MTAVLIDTYKAIGRLKKAGVQDTAAEEIVNIFGEICSNELATKHDLEILRKDLKIDIAEVKNEINVIKSDMAWIKKLLIAIGVTVFIAAFKYIFMAP